MVGEPDDQLTSLILGRRSYIDDILILAELLDALCTKVERFLDVCDYWNFSIRAVKRS